MKSCKKTFLITVLILGITWIIIMFLLCDFKSIGGTGIAGFIFGIISIILVLIMNLFSVRRQVENDSSVYVIPIAISVSYLGFSGLLNTILIVTDNTIRLNSKFISKIAIILNIVILAGYSIVSLHSLSYLGSVKQKDNDMRERTVKTVDISSMLGKTIAIAEQPDIKAALLKLKEMVDYSSNTSNKYTRETEQAFFDQISKIQQAISNGSNIEKTMTLINRASQTWRERNTFIN